jgi:hypothetical protein
MPVGIDDEADRIGIDGSGRGDDPIGERSELIVDQDIAVAAI